MKHEWTPLRPAAVLRHSKEEPYRATGPGSPDIWLNRFYQVERKQLASGAVILSIKPRDGSARHDWREFQWIKNQLCGDEADAVEKYPPESQLVDTANQFWLYVAPPGMKFPFGFQEREVTEARFSSTSTQRSWPREMKPLDLLTREEAKAKPDTGMWHDVFGTIVPQPKNAAPAEPAPEPEPEEKA